MPVVTDMRARARVTEHGSRGMQLGGKREWDETSPDTYIEGAYLGRSRERLLVGLAMRPGCVHALSADRRNRQLSKSPEATLKFVS